MATREVAMRAMALLVLVLAMSGSASADVVTGFDAAPNGSTTSDCQPGSDPCELQHAIDLAATDSHVGPKVVRLAAGDYDRGSTSVTVGAPMSIIGVDSARPRILSDLDAIHGTSGGVSL